MRVLFLIPHEVCNISCSYCFYNTGYLARSKSKIPLNEFSSLVDKIVALSFKTVILTGGDPLQINEKDNTFNLINLLKQKKIKVIVNTSGTLLNIADIHKLITLGIERIDISIDSHIQSIHNEQRGKYTDTVWTIKKLIKSNQNICTTTVITTNNISTINETIYWLKNNLKIKNIRFQEVFMVNKKNKNSLLILEKILSSTNSEHWQKYFQLIKNFYNKQDPPYCTSCKMGKDYFICYPNGTIVPCFHRQDLILGNIFTDEVKFLDQSFKVNKLTNIKIPPCFGAHCLSLFDNNHFLTGEISC